FHTRWLEHEHLSAYPKANISLLRPSMSFMMIQTPDPLTLKDALPDFSKTTHIFLPINDCRNVMEAEGGSHWSLLLVSVVDGVAFHYDSLCESNDHEARVATQKMATLLGRSLRFISMDDCPQQENGSDCGIFVCLLMRYLLLNRLLRADSKEKVSMSMAGKNVEASSGRKEMLKIIDGFRKEGRRRSYVSALSRRLKRTVGTLTMSLVRCSRSKSPFSDHSKSPPRIGDE
ncbi:NEDD8-specific protease 2, partial [Diplodia seriata]